MAHTCHAVGCENAVRPELLMCRTHWFSVPQKLRSRVWATYQDGQCDTLDPSSAYCQAAKAAVVAVAQKEGKYDPKHPKILLYDMLQTSDGDSV
jgi:hypothetical protein